MDEETRKAIALWRMAVLGPLISARLEHGDVCAWCASMAERDHQMPDGSVVRLSARTIESWLYDFRRGGFAALHPRRRRDRGISRAIDEELAELIVAAKREKPRRSIRRIIKMLVRAGKAKPGELSRSSVHRLLNAHGVSARPQRGVAGKERRSFLPEHGGDLCVGDSMHGPIVIAPDGTLRKSYLLSQIDGATRYLPYSYFALNEDACAQEYGFKQSILKHGVWRAYYVDRGPAYIAHSLRGICAELKIWLLNTETKDCEAKGVIERWHRTWRDEVGDELPTDPLPLAELNAIHWAWLSAEYHARVHDTTGRAPREHFISEAHELRPLPRNKNLDEVFLHRCKRDVRKDGTVRWGGAFLEVRAELTGKKGIELRYDPTDKTKLPQVFIDDKFYCDTVPLDRKANMHRKRRRVRGEPEPNHPKTGLDPLQLISDEHYRRARPVGAAPSKTHDEENDK